MWTRDAAATAQRRRSGSNFGVSGERTSGRGWSGRSRKKPRLGSRRRADRSSAGAGVHEGEPGRLSAPGDVPDLSSSGCHHWLKRPLSARARRDAELQGKIHLLWSGSRKIHGSPRIHAGPRAAGERVGRKRVARLMKRAGIQGATRGDAKARPAPGLVERDFSAGWPGRLRAADITHVRTWAGRSHLAFALDAWSRRVVGWAMVPRSPPSATPSASSAPGPTATSPPRWDAPAAWASRGSWTAARRASGPWPPP